MTVGAKRAVHTLASSDAALFEAMAQGELSSLGVLFDRHLRESLDVDVDPLRRAPKRPRRIRHELTSDKPFARIRRFVDDESMRIAA